MCHILIKILGLPGCDVTKIGNDVVKLEATKYHRLSSKIHWKPEATKCHLDDLRHIVTFL